jgi:hypothetical protein
VVQEQFAAQSAELPEMREIRALARFFVEIVSTPVYSGLLE